jgi:hypothetical protein
MTNATSRSARARQSWQFCIYKYSKMSQVWTKIHRNIGHFYMRLRVTCVITDQTSNIAWTSEDQEKLQWLLSQNYWQVTEHCDRVICIPTTHPTGLWFSVGPQTDYVHIILVLLSHSTCKFLKLSNHHFLQYRSTYVLLILHFVLYRMFMKQANMTLIQGPTLCPQTLKKYRSMSA